jgi:predicted S18 family serine protease
MWRTSGWTAALVATTLLDLDLGRYRISFDLTGLVDGTSAGALTTSGLLALLVDHGPLRADTTMTGTINPDGTVGPVGGIP